MFALRIEGFRWAAWLMMLFLSLPVWAVDWVAVPALSARVTDGVGILRPEQRAALESRLAQIEKIRGAQVAVLIVPRTAPEAIEQYSIRVAEAWKLGKKGVDNGLLIVVAVEERTMRIEVGYGLEGVIPDAIAKRVIAEVITPRFKVGDYFGGLEAGLIAIDRLIGKETGALPAPRAPSKVSSGEIIAVAVLVLVGLAAGALRLVLGRVVGSLVTGGLAGFLVWWLAGSLLIGLLVAVGVFFFVVSGLYQLLESRGSDRPGGGFGGGGGFRGGGGGFGGGGASGRW